MSIDKQIVEEERKVMGEIFQLCNGDLQRIAMRKSSQYIIMQRFWKKFIH